MNPILESLPVILETFAILFSNRWISLWLKGQGTQKRREAKGKASEKQKTKAGFYQRIFSLRVTLWYLIYQRLNFDVTHSGVVVNLREGGADRLSQPGGPKLSRRVRSTKTSAYSQARKRLPLELLQAALAHLRGYVLKITGLASAPKRKPQPTKRERQLVDGSTISMLFTPELAMAFPPARNQNGASDWCLMRVLVGFCARSGAVLSAIEGAVQQSEQALMWTLIERAAAFTIWIGDRNFGVWSVVAQAVRYKQDVLVRLTLARARRLCQGQPLQAGQERLIHWEPTRSDKAPAGLERTAVVGRLIYVRIQKAGKWIDLWLFTTLDAQDYPVALLIKWYAQRWQAELNFRSLKTEMKMVKLNIRTPIMARKEFYAGMLAYTLVRVVMWGAGERLENEIKTLSFNEARRVLLERLKDWGRGVATATKGASHWAKELLQEVSQHKLPKRRKPRPTEVRRVRHQRQKFPPLKGSRAAARARDLQTKS
jgi:hypothetical protein